MMTGSKEERGGWDRERSANQDLRTPKAAICWRAGHEAIGGNMNIFYMFWLLFYTLFKQNFVEFIKEKV